MHSVNIELARSNMIEQQIRPWDVLDFKILDVLAKIPREQFVPAGQEDKAFMDIEIPLGHGEAMLSPKLDGRALQALSLKPSDSVLEIGTGSGFLTACLADLCTSVFSVELHQDLYETATANLQKQGIPNTTLWCGDAAHGWIEGPQRYDAIVVSGSLPEYDACFEQQLKLNGRLFVVTGHNPVMKAKLITRVGDNDFTRQDLFETSLKPLVGLAEESKFVF